MTNVNKYKKALNSHGANLYKKIEEFLVKFSTLALTFKWS